ncbi:hypothetical protein GH733_015471 [Mirounga leonina]|nr:hypothetical protein GH733_015471 [Mirounga leonina]
MWKVLLSPLKAYVEHFTQAQLKKVPLPQASPGWLDARDSIVAVTLHSLAVLVSLLGPEVMVGGERPPASNSLPQVLRKLLTFPQKVPQKTVKTSHQGLTRLKSDYPTRQRGMQPKLSMHISVLQNYTAVKAPLTHYCRGDVG